MKCLLSQYWKLKSEDSAKPSHTSNTAYEGVAVVPTSAIFLWISCSGLNQAHTCQSISCVLFQFLLSFQSLFCYSFWANTKLDVGPSLHKVMMATLSVGHVDLVKLCKSVSYMLNLQCTQCFK